MHFKKNLTFVKTICSLKPKVLAWAYQLAINFIVFEILVSR